MTVTDKQLENLIPAKKGEVRNPNGRTAGIPNAKTRYKRLLELVTTKTNPVTGEEEEFTQIELMDIALFNKALKGDIRAYQEIMDRLEGKPSQSVDVTSNGKDFFEQNELTIRIVDDRTNLEQETTEGKGTTE